MTSDVTVVIPTIPMRRDLLARALLSVTGQTHPVAAVAIAMDTDRSGAWATRNRAASMVRTTWTAFLDDDDELLPHHVEHLLAVAKNEHADVAWGWFDVRGGTDPFPHYRGRQYDPGQPHIVPITYLVRTEVLHAAMDAIGGFQPDVGGSWDVQDRPLLDTMVRLGAHLHACPDTTWVWHHHGSNTSGLPTRW
jgi:hypothetical protein